MIIALVQVGNFALYSFLLALKVETLRYRILVPQETGDVELWHTRELRNVCYRAFPYSFMTEKKIFLQDFLFRLILLVMLQLLYNYSSF